MSCHQLIAETAIVSFVSAVCLLCITVVRGLDKIIGATSRPERNREDADDVASLRFTLRTIIHECPTTNIKSTLPCCYPIAVSALISCRQSRGIKLQRRSKQFGGDDPPMQPVSILFLFAIFMDSIQAIGSILNVRWAFEGQVTEGTYCNAQGLSRPLANILRPCPGHLRPMMF